MTKDRLSALSADLIRWYWTHGSQRESRFQLSPSGWLFRLYRLHERLRALADETGDKPAFGLWGPSQVGKSTLLSFYLDFGADEVGQNSLIQWHPKDPIRFERDGLRTDIIALNPYNLKSDASACITRFVLVTEVPEPRHPVEVSLATRSQILHSMALGHLSDWNQSGLQSLSDESLGEIIAKLPTKSKQSNANAYEIAYETASLLEVLTKSRLQETRYSGLSARTPMRILESSPIVGNEANAEALQRKLFWGDSPSLTRLHEGLRNARQRIVSLSGGTQCKILCSYEASAYFLDMASYVRAVGGTDMQGNRIEPDLAYERRLLGIKCKTSNGRLLLGMEEGSSLFENVEQFAFFQALVWELVVPVNGTRLSQAGPEVQSFASLLSATDILDFPGVSNIGTGGDDRLNDAIVSKNGSHLLFSHFLKRGKTSAMVAATARSRHIDGFCLLFRTMGPIARPGLICDGIRTWWRFHTGEDLNAQNTDSPPVNIVLTFFAEFLNDVLRNPQITRFSLAFEKLRSLGTISSTEISRYFAVAFPKYERLTFPAGSVSTQEMAMASLEEAVLRIMSDSETGALLKDADILRRCIHDNGVSNLLENLTAQANAVQGTKRLRKHLLNAQQELRQLIDEAAPGDALEQSRRQELLNKWDIEIRSRLGLNGAFNQQASESMSHGIRRLLTVLPDDLESLPVNLVDGGRDPKVYLQLQLVRWREKDRSDFDPHQSGLNDSGDAARILAYFCESIDLEHAIEWLRINFGWISDRSVARDSRRYLALYLTDRLMISDTNVPRKYRSLESGNGNDAYTALRKLAEAEALTSGTASSSCPHFLSVISPFLIRIAELGTRSGAGRPPQPGDQELTAIQSGYQNVVGPTPL